jgi:uncharacterized repeat protein (TIGR02543 family)
MLAFSLASCDPTTGSNASSSDSAADSGSSFKVSYDANGATSGAVPTDSGAYVAGATVTVLGNTGSLAKTGYSFSGWNTAASGSGTSYAAGATFAMGSANVTLYASWTASTTTSSSWKKRTTKVYNSTDALIGTTVSVRDGATITDSDYDASGAASGSAVNTFNASDKLIKQVAYNTDGSVYHSTTITYNSAQQETRRDFEVPAASSSSYYELTTYDGSGASTKQHYTTADVLQSTTVSTYDSHGNPLTWTTTAPSVSGSMIYSYTYVYNSSFLIMKETIVWTGTGDYSSSAGTTVYEYERDSLGRETKWTTTLNGSKSMYWIYTYES